MLVVIGTKNSAKVTAVKEAFSCLTNIQFVEQKVPSNVSDQPMSFDETRIGAIGRANNAIAIHKEADFAIGLEGGLHKQEDGWYLCNWGALVTKNNETFLSGGMSIKLPDEIISEVQKGKELADVMDEYTSKKNGRHNEGAVGVFTNGFVYRKDLFIPIVKLLYGQYNFKEEENKVR